MTRQRRRRGEELVSTHTDQEPAKIPSFDGVPHSCGGSFALVRGPQEVPIRGKMVTVEAEFYRCSGCGEERFDPLQVDAARAAAAVKLTQDEGLLTPEEILALRESFGLTQAGFEAALGFGAKTVVRWESGAVVPGRAAALLLVALRRDPSLMRYFDALARGERPAEKIVTISSQ
ncbi:MAG: type II toxin-antitoxin system MqsA family antitoxin [Gemmatimonadales bacterium]|nr:type II toxin-antitoxin system MqsA family antitoxin [Gemmatimonadales bacterium]